MSNYAELEAKALLEIENAYKEGWCSGWEAKRVGDTGTARDHFMKSDALRSFRRRHAHADIKEVDEDKPVRIDVPWLAEEFMESVKSWKEPEDMYPVTIVTTRYGGAYELYGQEHREGESVDYIAFNLEAHAVPYDPFGGDPECHNWFHENFGKFPYGLGATPNEALKDLHLWRAHIRAMNVLPPDPPDKKNKEDDQ